MNAGQRLQAGPMLTQLGLGRPMGNLLIGADGSEFVASLLRSKGPSAAVQELQANYGLQHPLCKPLLQMLDYLDISRREAHMYILTRARKLLLDWIAGVRAAAGQRNSDAGGELAESQEEVQLQEKLERLLNASFKYMGVPELQQVPLEVMNTMTHVPAPYLKQLAEDREIFNQLPAAVKQQVYEYDRNLLQQDAVQYIAAYKYELGTILAALNMCQFVRTRSRVLDKPSKRRNTSSESGMSGGAFGGGGSSGGGAPAIPKPGSGRGRSLVGRSPQQRGMGAVGGFNMSAVLTAVGKDGDRGAAESSPHHGASGSSGLSNAGPGPQRPTAAGPLLPSRKTVRSGSEAIKQLREMVGNSGKVYGHLLELCEVRLKESPSPYLGSKELSYCALRTQLLMSLHDSSLKGPSSKAAAGGRREKDFLSRIREQLPREGRSHDVVWLLDAALIQRRLTLPHLRKLAELFTGYLKPPTKFVEEEDDPAAATRPSPAAATTTKGNPRSAAAVAAKIAIQPAVGKKRGAATPAAAAAGSVGGGRLKKQRLSGAGWAGGGGGLRDFGDDDDDAGFVEDWQDDNSEEMNDFIVKDDLDAEDACGANAANTQDRWLAEAGMVLRDPPAMHMLAAEVVDTLYRCMGSYRLPADVPQLPWLLRLMQLGVDARHSLREKQYLMPKVAMHELHTVWAELLVLLCEGEAEAEPWDQNRQRQPGQASGVQQGTATQQQNSDGWQLLVKEYSRQEVFRKVVQMLCLDRLVNGDLMTARQLLELMLASRHLTTPAAIPEYAPFAYSLASVLQDLVKAKQLSASSSFWQVAVGKVLLALVDSDSQVHIEVLRLLLSVAKEVGPDSLAASLGHMLTATAASRARATTQKKKFASITAQYGHAGHDHGVPGYISLGGAASEWSDGFRTVRSLKYGGSSDGFSELYRKIVVVGGLSDKQEKWPEALTRYMKEVDQRREQEEEARRAERAAARDEAERQAAGDP